MLLMTLHYNTFVIWAGPVPVVITPTVELYAGANGQITAQVVYKVATCGEGKIKLTGSLAANLQGFFNVSISWFSLK
ncbi:hypothetical protein CTI14_42540, partial [Methylobacterium radiotolerans]